MPGDDRRPRGGESRPRFTLQRGISTVRAAFLFSARASFPSIRPMLPRKGLSSPLRWFALGGVLTASVSCGGSQPVSVTPQRDPTPLAKCKVAPSQSSPLVTEWPASEKAHLESMLSDRTVAVSYSGCDLKILDACRIKGSYSFHRTTLATDTIEIKSEDDLYAKLPLGAVSLEGELQRSGRLAVRTTVAGQLRLNEEISDFPTTGACAKATHVVTALSVGTFKLLSGGGISGRAGVAVGTAGAGAKVSRDEEVLREAGDPSTCAQVKSADSSSQCSSPIQIFLEPIERNATAAASVEPDDSPGTSPRLPREDLRNGVGASDDAGTADDSRPGKDAVQVSFQAPDSGKWALRAKDGKVLCDLPCTRWVPPHSGMVVALDADKSEDIVKIPVPDDLGYSAGRKVNAVPQQGRGGAWPGTAAGFGVAGVVVGALLMANSEKGCGAPTIPSETNSNEQVPNDGYCTPGIGIVIGSSVLTVVGGAVWIFYNRTEKLDLSLASPDGAARRDRPVFQLGPGFAQGTF